MVEVSSGFADEVWRRRHFESDLATLMSERAIFLAEILAIGDAIEATRLDIAALGGNDIRYHVPEVTNELDAIVLDSAEAADAILDTCERLDSDAAKMPDECKTPIQQATTRIFEACSFQDIIGQRAAKMDQVLRLIDCKVAHILIAFSEFPASPYIPLKREYLEGPKRDGTGMKQDAVDALLASFE